MCPSSEVNSSSVAYMRREKTALISVVVRKCVTNPLFFLQSYEGNRKIVPGQEEFKLKPDFVCMVIKKNIQFKLTEAFEIPTGVYTIRFK